MSEWDHVARQLQEWRRAADEPSYSEIALRISRLRESRGQDPAAARVGRTTVYDAFRHGRARINRALVREIGEALGVAEAEVTALLDGPPATATAAAGAVMPGEVMPSEVAPSDVTPAPRYDIRQSAVLMLIFLGVNFLGRELVDALQVTLYLDMAGTALAAIILGPWRGAAVGRTLARFFALNLMVAVACTLTAVPILYFVFGGTVGHEQDTLTENVQALTQNFVTALYGRTCSRRSPTRRSARSSPSWARPCSDTASVGCPRVHRRSSWGCSVHRDVQVPRLSDVLGLPAHPDVEAVSTSG